MPRATGYRWHMKVLRLLDTDVPPHAGTRGAAGFGLAAAERVVIPQDRPHGGGVAIGRAHARTGVSVDLAPSSVGRIGSRSGPSVRHNVEVAGGWIDPNYRGEFLTKLKDLGNRAIVLERGTRIAQLFVLRTVPARPRLVAGGLGSTRRQTRGIGSSDALLGSRRRTN